VVANNRLSGQQKDFAHLGNRPEDKHYEEKGRQPSIEFFWVGLKVVQKRNIRKKINPETREEELIYNQEPEKWDSPTYLILQRIITMPPLGESLVLNEWTATRLLEQMPEGSLLTAQQGGKAIAEYLKEQIENGVPLPEISKGEYGLNKPKGLPDGVALGEMFGNLDDDEIRRILKERGMTTLLEGTAAVEEPIEQPIDK